MHLLSITNTSFKVYRIAYVQYSAALYQIPVLNSACIRFGDKYSAIVNIKVTCKIKFILFTMQLLNYKNPQKQ